MSGQESFAMLLFLYATLRHFGSNWQEDIKAAEAQTGVTILKCTTWQSQASVKAGRDNQNLKRMRSHRAQQGAEFLNVPATLLAMALAAISYLGNRH